MNAAARHGFHHLRKKWRYRVSSSANGRRDWEQDFEVGSQASKVWLAADVPFPVACSWQRRSGALLAQRERSSGLTPREKLPNLSQRYGLHVLPPLASNAAYNQVLKRLSRELDIKAPNAASASTLAQLDPTPNFDTNLPQPATPAPYFPPEQDQLPLQFYTDLGLGLPNESSTFDFWTGGTGPSPPDFAFLGATVDWSAVGASADATEAVGAASSMAANALLEQLAVGW